nr:MAG TPA: hypothetical protein [Caudoviricetes sp.]
MASGVQEYESYRICLHWICLLRLWFHFGRCYFVSENPQR